MNMKTITYLMIALVSALALAGTVAAGGDPSKAGKKLTEEQTELMSILDVNGDGIISEAEVQRHPEMAARFRELDANSDGVLERAEFARFEVTEEDVEQLEDRPRH